MLSPFGGQAGKANDTGAQVRADHGRDVDEHRRGDMGYEVIDPFPHRLQPGRSVRVDQRDLL